MVMVSMLSGTMIFIILCSHLTGAKGYYADYGTLDHLQKAYREGFVYSWDYSLNRRRFHGSSSMQVPGRKLVVCVQNHDQIGNRLLGASFDDSSI